MKADAKKRLPERNEPLAERLPYPGGFPVYLARYVLFGGKTPRVAMRFFNASDILITGLRFRLIERDAEGNAVAEYILERRGLFAERGTEFAVSDAPVDAACVAVEARVESVLSDGYEYIAEKDGVTLKYGVREKKREYTFRHKPEYSVSKRKKKYVIFAFLMVIGVAAVSMALAWRLHAFDEIFGEQPSAALMEDGAC